MTKVGTIGAGAFGTAVACALAAGGNDVTLWGRDADHIASIAKQGKNSRYLPDTVLPRNLNVSSQLHVALDSEIVLLVVPAQHLRSVLKLKAFQTCTAPLVLCAKGIEQDTGFLQTEIADQILPNAKLAVITGPSFAAEIAEGKPTALTLATADHTLGTKLQSALSTQSLRLYLSDDPIGAQLGGALKNVLAIACGVVSGAGLGESARAALMTRGFVEVTQLARALGAQTSTLAGLSGFGDLVLTCTSSQSRNFDFGSNLGRSGEFGTGKTVEGIATARATVDLAAKHGIEMPIARVVADVLEKKKTIPNALEALMSRPLRSEG